MQQQEPKRWPCRAAGELQHWDIAIRVAPGNNRPPTNPAPDSHRLFQAVIEEVQLRLVDDRAATLIRLVTQSECTSDDALRGGCRKGMPLLDA